MTWAGWPGWAGKAGAVGLVLLAFLLIVVTAGVADAQTPETIGEVRVHGNHTTPDVDVLTLAGLTVGTQVSDASLREAGERLRKSGRFADVEVRKRYRSIDNPSDILVIILVDEHAAVAEDDLTPGPFKRLGSTGMWLPILDYADGYGFTYGARVSFVDTLGARSRISVPMTWGGERKIAVEAERAFDRGPFSRVLGSVSVSRRENPHFGLSDRRQEGRLRAERTLTSWLRVGGGVRLTNVKFDGVEERHFAPGIDLMIDTRTDPAFPRNAVHATAGVEQLRFSRPPTLLAASPSTTLWAGDGRMTRWTTDVRGYVGLIRSTVLALRAVAIHASEPLPRYEQALLGAATGLRGYEFGYRAGDSLAAMSAELRLPLTSPLSVGRFGVKGFVDAGTVYNAGARLGDQRFDRGIGGGVFFTATVVRAGLDVAWPQSGNKKPRVHFGLGVTF